VKASKKWKMKIKLECLNIKELKKASLKGRLGGASLCL